MLLQPVTNFIKKTIFSCYLKNSGIRSRIRANMSRIANTDEHQIKGKKSPVEMV
jgi:hypothetical protein